MNVYEENSSLKETSYCSLQLHEKTVTEKLAPLTDEKKPLSHYSVLAQGLEEDLKNEKELTVQVGCTAGLYIRKNKEFVSVIHFID